MNDHVEVFFHSQQPYVHVKEEDLEKYDSGRLSFPNTFFDPEKAHALYNQYHEQYILADESGLDGIMTNEHHASYWNMKPSANIDAAVISRLTKKVRIAILGNIIPINDPVRMAEELAMLDCYSEGRLISGFMRGGAVETLQAGIGNLFLQSIQEGRLFRKAGLLKTCHTAIGTQCVQQLRDGQVGREVFFRDD